MKEKLLKALFCLLVLSGFLNPGHSNATIYLVTTTSYTGAGSISQAVTNANGSGGKDTIYFSIPGIGPYTINMSPELVINGDLLIDGTSQSGYDPLFPKPVIELKNSPAMAFIINGGASDIRAIGINNCALGIVYNTPNNKLTGCYIGLGLDGITDSGNNGHGIIINPTSTGNIIGGITPAERNIISGNNNGHAILITASSANYIIGNYLGTNASGTVAVPNSFMGIQMDNSSGNIIGGASADSSNLISGNGQSAIQIIGGNFNRIAGNTVGLQADKTTALGNSGSGIYLNNCNFTQIGGTGTLSGNIISANGSIGINIENSKFTLIKSNIIGTSQNTQLARGNLANGIQLTNSRQTIIGGDRLMEGNIISASGGAGINFEGGGSNKTIIKGNFIGTDNTGKLALGNFVIGIILKSDSCTIGSTNPGEGNIIVDTKLFCGLLIADANATIVKGNMIGAGLDTSALPNKTDGINISVETNGKSASDNIIQNNVIAYNMDHGINVGNALNNNINNNEKNNDLRFNSIFCNQKLGISLTLANPANQGNNGKVAPLINNALSTTTKVVGLANGLLPTDLIDIYEMTECINCDLNPQGKKYIATVSPDAAGNWSYNNGSPITGTLIATATDAQRNTSQFSLCFTPCMAKAKVDPSEYSIKLDPNATIPVTLTSSSVFSTITPVPGKLFWSSGAPDTTGFRLFSKAPSISLNFSVGGNFGPGLYEIYLIAQQAGCLDTTMVKINVFFIPNMITPNGDHMNDTWVVGNGHGQFDAKIFNRWGDLVYSKSDYSNEWDGAGLGDGVYYYLLEDKIQEKKSYKGWVQIVK
jgi:gliding motility-associated-like protein